ncbi:methionine--tRNA ligase [Dehalococcoides mccartyi]|jgi:methionyl-tRNA synthetase|uniref:methionine--tRNA ligase n=2 Tax=Dehalococcoides mccartyi TaxID=61435 RepID=UPI0004E03DEC|nr:methionine--tRNA ligase [Dehalococcoides mccartyi]AII57537.1 methionyl-tRNA synthetase [Dehalococcoides mccartyi CG1]APH12028.1 methionine--tRNA ligase [Dehalococcoides mccartyi]
MSERIFIGVAWPYANSQLHLGHVAGAYLPADIFARYHRTRGDEVLMVSGSDMHGTPITIRAEQEGITAAEVAERYHRLFMASWPKLGISWDCYTSTATANHARTAQEMFLSLYEKGYIYKDTVCQPFCPRCNRFLPDRYVEGTCPHCKYEGARGDQCDNCGKPLNAAELLNFRCKNCGNPPEFKETEHFFLKLSAFEEELLRWVENKTHWRTNVLNFTLRYLKEGLKDRAITRDLDWGVPLPLPGYEGKRLYVWFEAVIGYLSASIEWAVAKGQPGEWQKYWGGDTKSYYFIGKDNIPFHTIIWPAMLMGKGGLNLPYDVPSNEYLTIEAQKFSKSRNKAIWVDDVLSRYSVDTLRYLLSANMPESSDMDFSWREFVRRNNDELVATYGNLAQRVLTMVCRNFDNKVPEYGKLDERSLNLIEKTSAMLSETDKALHGCNFREAIKLAMSLAQEANRYLDEKAPWKEIKVDKAAAARSLYVAMAALSGLRVAFYPFLPESSSRLSTYLGFGSEIEKDGWVLKMPVVGQEMTPPEPLFKKLEDSVVEEEAARMGL